MNTIHYSAIVEEGAQLGDNVTIGPFTIIGKDVIIGDSTTIDSHTLITGKTTIGENNHIYSHATIGTAPQDSSFDGEEVELIIGDNNTIREYTLFNAGTAKGGGKTIIGNNNFFMGYVHVAHDCIIGNNCTFANAVTFAGHVECGDYTVIGGLVPIHQFCKIGSSVMIGGGSVVTQDIPHYCLAEGNRAKVKNLNIVGLKRRFDNIDIINELKQAYKKLFRNKNKSIQDSALEILNENKNKEVIKLCEFILNTKRGIPINKLK